ncbi:MAG: RRXRR domain-containing protein [Oligoflexia bacterium]|nr:RRXRR domain-containing protein [Oligoflexia bacterium]
MQKVFVLSSSEKPLMPCHPARARELLREKNARVYCLFPFTIILLSRKKGDIQKIELKIDPGSKTTGITIVAENILLYAINLQHRGEAIRDTLRSQRANRRSRRNRVHDLTEKQDLRR